MVKWLFFFFSIFSKELKTNLDFWSALRVDATYLFFLFFPQNAKEQTITVYGWAEQVTFSISI